MRKSKLIERLFVIHRCAGCRKILSQKEFDNAFCSSCELSFRSATTECCPKCFRSAIECTCQPKALNRAGSLCLRKLFFYQSDRENEPQNRLVYFLKRNRNQRILDFVAEELYAELKTELKELGVDGQTDKVLLVNVPRGKPAIFEYGFDQSEQICNSISKLSGIQYLPLIKRKFGGKEQKRLSAVERRKNIKKLLMPDKRYSALARNKYIILFDDIVTTGSSMVACLSILRKMGVRGVICSTLATDIKKKRNI